jgi:carbamoyltransferase
MKILGISAYYHNSAAALIFDGEVLCAAEEERFTRKKNDASFPSNAVEFCLSFSKTSLDEIDAVVFYDKPFLKFERIIESLIKSAPLGYRMFVNSVPIWVKQKLTIKQQIKNELRELGSELNRGKVPKILFSNHHLSHAASCFYASNFEESAILTIDGVGEWATASIAIGRGNKIKTLCEMHYPDSVGLMYSAFTAFLGFEVNNGEYKVMGLAPYVKEDNSEVLRIKRLIVENMVSIHADGSISLNKFYFTLESLRSMINVSRAEKLLLINQRKPNEEILPNHVYLAQALQSVTKDIIIAMAKHAKKLTGLDNICLAGGVALNCVVNGNLLEEGIFRNIYIQPASGDSGGALGAAWASYYMHFNNKRVCDNNSYDKMKSSKLGPCYSEQEIISCLNEQQLKYQKLDKDTFINEVAKQLMAGKVVGWFNGKMEFGPRALGSRSIIASAAIGNMQSKLNLKVKKRESFRPFAPVMLMSDFKKLFGLDHRSPYMLFVHKIQESYRIEADENLNDLYYTINQKRSVLPAITHIDHSSRIQTIDDEDDGQLANLLRKFKLLTGYGVLINTSFNVKDEPIVCAPQDAINCFLQTDIDILAFENIIVSKC